jgi:hypothetical protein
MPKKSTKELPPTPVKVVEVLLPIYFRITVDGERTEFSTGQTVAFDNWNQTRGKVKGTSERARLANENLEGFLNRAKKAHQDLSEKGKQITAAALRNQMLGIGDDFHQIVECFENFVKEIKLKVGSDYKVGTLKIYNVTLGHLKEFIASNYFAKDIPLKDLNYKFITDFELMCKTKWDCAKSSTTTKHIQRIRKVIGIAIANEWLDKDPFHLYTGNTKREPLSS